MASAFSLPSVTSGELPHLSYAGLSDFLNRQCIYTGRLSTVWGALCRISHARVVIKQYHKERMQAVHFQQVQNEAAALELFAANRFTGAPRYFGKWEDDNSIFLVLERCTGGSVYDRMKEGHKCMKEQLLAAEVVLPLLLVLDFAHRHSLVHRDVKPEHCLFTDEGAFKLADWGLAMFQGASHQQGGTVVGTLDYLAPEVAVLSLNGTGARSDATASYGCKVDVWALGVLCYEALLGKPPFAEESQQQTAHNIVFEDFMKPLPKSTSRACQDFVRRALCKHPDNRPTAAELLSHPWILPHYHKAQATGHHAGIIMGSLPDSSLPTAFFVHRGSSPILEQRGPRAISCENVLRTPPPLRRDKPTLSCELADEVSYSQPRARSMLTVRRRERDLVVSNSLGNLTPRKRASIWQSFKDLSRKLRGNAKDKSPVRSPSRGLFRGGSKSPSPATQSHTMDTQTAIPMDASVMRGHALITPFAAMSRNKARCTTTRSRFATATDRQTVALQEVATPLQHRFDAVA